MATILPLLADVARAADSPAPSQSAATSSLSSGAAEVAQLARSGVSNDVVLAFIRQSQSYYNLSAAEIATLKNAGVSSQALTAMLNHDSAVRTQQQSASSVVATPASPQVIIAETNTVSATASAATTSTASGLVVRPEPPAPQVDVIPASPGPEYLWNPGWWSWNGGAWIWIGGYWHYPSLPGRVWIGGYWTGHGRGRHWAAGHWR